MLALRRCKRNRAGDKKSSRHTPCAVRQKLVGCVKHPQGSKSYSRVSRGFSLLRGRTLTAKHPEASENRALFGPLQGWVCEANRWELWVPHGAEPLKTLTEVEPVAQRTIGGLRAPLALRLRRSIDSQEFAGKLIAFSDFSGDSSRQRNEIGIERTDNDAGMVRTQAVKANKMATVHGKNATSSNTANSRTLSSGQLCPALPVSRTVSTSCPRRRSSQRPAAESSRSNTVVPPITPLRWLESARRFVAMQPHIGPRVGEVLGRQVDSAKKVCLASAQPPSLFQDPHRDSGADDARFAPANAGNTFDSRKGITQVASDPLQHLGLFRPRHAGQNSFCFDERICHKLNSRRMSIAILPVSAILSEARWPSTVSARSPERRRVLVHAALAMENSYSSGGT